MDVLGIEVDGCLVQRWAGWLAPACQPFFLTAAELAELGFTADTSSRDLPSELRDTYQVWNVARDLETVWLDQPAFRDQPEEVRAELVRAQVRHGRGAVPAVAGWSDLLDARVLREQADGDRFVWWPSLVQPRTGAVLQRYVSEDQLPCRRRSVPEGIWRAAAPTLPQARTLSGTFANGSGANCFGTVMAAAGVEGVAEVWTVREPFEAWLAANCIGGGSDDQPGTVLVWRDAAGAGTHAAVTLGGGWALHKPGQEWSSPRQVLMVPDLIRTAPPGVIAHRYSLQAAESP